MNAIPPRRVVLFANGELPDPDYAQSLLQPDDLIVVADGGTRHAHRLGVVPALLVGDSDSLPEALRAWLAAHRVPHHAYPRAKDATDLELALRHALDLGAPTLLLLGAAGGRVDHTVANLSLLALARARSVQLEVVVAREHLYLVWGRLVLRGQAGQTISLLPWGGDAEGVQTEGLAWELRGERLPFGPARGISNVMRADSVTIALTAGMLLVCHQRGEVA